MKPVTPKYDEILKLEGAEELAFMRNPENKKLWNRAHQEKRIREDLNFMVAIIADVAKDIAVEYKLSPSGAYSALDLAVKLLQSENAVDLMDRGLNVNVG